MVWTFFYFHIFCFYSLSSYGHFEDIRLAAIECLVDLSKCELPYPITFVPLRLIFHLNLFPWKIVSLKVSFQLTTISNDSKHFKRRLTAPLMFRLKLVAFGLFLVGNDFTNIPSSISPKDDVKRRENILLFFFFQPRTLKEEWFTWLVLLRETRFHLSGLYQLWLLVWSKIFKPNYSFYRPHALREKNLLFNSLLLCKLVHLQWEMLNLDSPLRLCDWRVTSPHSFSSLYCKQLMIIDKRIC